MINFTRLYYTNGSYARVNGWHIFKSYNTFIGCYDITNKIMYKDKYFYSSSTSRQFNRFCRDILGVEPTDKNWKKNNLQLCESEEITNLINNEIL